MKVVSVMKGKSGRKTNEKICRIKSKNIKLFKS